ncbi:PREDICTED: uncharacterized protein LOC107357290 [Acropora digitifera]|uniref:uncharacterized protein LOC107357290 n=1 Tax=Acropora digitifera TaxID=70779 RepID=UPI00077A8829|nr:PREDICTED: uncharacterized protein LOC107357290 [Acropora digitifera]XP_015779416.1 PREDICTED: uncharacterized protein LOC107357290 [Acropora digitifera]
MGKLLVTSDVKSCCCWKSAMRRVHVVRIHQSSFLEAKLFAFDGARGRRQYGHFIPRTKLFRSLAGRRNESGYIRHICCMELRNPCMVQDPPLFFKATMSGLDVSIMVPHWYLQ